jgi:hypothetical protein
VNKASLAARQDNARFPQSHQVLGKISLPPAKSCFQVADTGLALANRKQDLQPGGLVDALQEAGHFFNGQYIPIHEYIISSLFNPD